MQTRRNERLSRRSRRRAGRRRRRGGRHRAGPHRRRDAARALAPGHRPTVTGDARVDTLLSQTDPRREADPASRARPRPPARTSSTRPGYLPGIPRLGIPSLKLTDGPPGVITKQDSTGMTSTMGVAATFSQTDAQGQRRRHRPRRARLGQDVVLEPFVNMDRDTSWGRGFNTFGEDPLLTGQTGADEITGIQSQGEMAQVKHYIAYDGGNNVDVDSQTLHEIYLQPFADAVNAGVSSVMCSYNVVNGYQACGNATTLTADPAQRARLQGLRHLRLGRQPRHDLPQRRPRHGDAGRRRTGRRRPAVLLRQGHHEGRHRQRVDPGVTGHRGGRPDPLRDGPVRPAHRPLEAHVTAENTAAGRGHRAADGAGRSDAAEERPATHFRWSSNDLSSLAVIGPGAGQTIATNSGGEAAGGLLDQQPSALSTLQGRRARRAHHVRGGGRADRRPGARVGLLAHGQPGLTAYGQPGPDAGRPAAELHRARTTTRSRQAAPTPGPVTLTIPTAGSYWLNIQALGATGTLVVDGKTLTTVGGGFGPAPRYGVVHPTDGNAPTATTDGLANGRTLVT